MKKLQIYFLKEFLSIFFPVQVFFIFVFALSEVFWRFGDFILHKPKFVDVINFLSLHVSLWFVQTLPISLMLSTVLSVSFFTYYREIIAIKTLGIDTKQFFVTWLVMGLLFSIFSFFVNDKVATKNFYKAQEIFYTKIKKEKFEKDFLKDLFYYFYHGDLLTYIFIDKYDKTNNKVYSFLMQQYQNGRIKFQIFSNEGIKDNLSLILSNAIIQQFYNNASVVEKIVKNYRYLLPVDVENFKYNFSTMQLDQLNLNQLKQVVKICKFRGESSNRILTEISFRYSIAFLNFIIVFFAIALGQISSSQHGKLNSLVYVILVFIVYWTFLSFLRTLGETGVINPYLSVWIPNIIFFLIGTVLYTRKYL